MWVDGSPVSGFSGVWKGRSSQSTQLFAGKCLFCQEMTCVQWKITFTFYSLGLLFSSPLCPDLSGGLVHIYPRWLTSPKQVGKLDCESESHWGIFLVQNLPQFTSHLLVSNTRGYLSCDVSEECTDYYCVTEKSNVPFCTIVFPWYISYLDCSRKGFKFPLSIIIVIRKRTVINGWRLMPMFL